MPLSQFKPDRYREQLDAKLAATLPAFANFFQGKYAVIESAATHYRMRAEFRMWHEGDQVDFVMFRPDQPRTPHPIQRFPVASRHISERMPLLKQHLDDTPLLRHKLFQVEFLTTVGDDTMLSLIYHKKLDESWLAAARELEARLGVKVIGRSRKQKVVVSSDYVTETIAAGTRTYQYRQGEGVFTQPNAEVNRQMIEWVLNQVEPDQDDLLELYCGIGNFTLPLAQRFRRVLATEISKQAVALARHNAQLNQIDNLALLRMSSEEFSQARRQVRAFRRLADLDLASYRLHTALVDPPRSGLDPETLAVIKEIPRIIYISCNPGTLVDNLQQLSTSHTVQQLAFFDQFPYTDHLECGVILTARQG